MSSYSLAQVTQARIHMHVCTRTHTHTHTQSSKVGICLMEMIKLVNKIKSIYRTLPQSPGLTNNVYVLIAQLCPTLCDPIDCSPPGSSVHGILQAGTLEWVAIPFSRISSWPRNWTPVSYIAGRFFTIWTTREALNTYYPLSFPLIVVKLLSLVWLFCEPMDYSPPSSPVHGISQARTLEWVAISFSRGSSQPRIKPQTPTLASRFFTTEPPGIPFPY